MLIFLYDKGFLKDKYTYEYMLDVYKLVCSYFYCMWYADLKCTLVIGMIDHFVNSDYMIEK